MEKSNASNSTSKSEYLPFSDSVFFVITTITTIGKENKELYLIFKLRDTIFSYWYSGYGRKSPQTDLGKITSILIAAIGIPINIVFLAKIGEVLKLLTKRLLRPLRKISKNKKVFIVLEVYITSFEGGNKKSFKYLKF